MKVLITGASGFVGRAVVKYLNHHSAHLVSCAVRTERATENVKNQGVPVNVVGDINAETDWHEALSGVECVVHCAARVHVMHDEGDALPLYRQVNLDGTLKLAEQAVASGVKRFIFVSSIKVNGETAGHCKPFTASAEPDPHGGYAISKLEAELALSELAQKTGLEVVVIRPPLVYGPGVKANFLSLVNWVAKGIPLPLGAIDNKRSLLFVDNLADLILTCIAHPNASGKTFLASDGDDLSVSELLSQIAQAQGRPSRAIPVPVGVLRSVGRLCGQEDKVSRLCDSLCVDITDTLETLDWRPPYRVKDGLDATMAALGRCK